MAPALWGLVAGKKVNLWKETLFFQSQLYYDVVSAPDEDEYDEWYRYEEDDLPGFHIVINNKVTHNLGIEVFGGKFSCLIQKGTDIPEDSPAVATKEYGTPRDNMTELAIRVYQSPKEAEYVSSEDVKCIGEFFLTGIPPKPRGQERITVNFEIDQQNLLKVRASSSSSSKELEIREL